MDLYLQSTLSPESSDCAVAPVHSEQVSRGPPARTETHPTAGFEQSRGPKFNIRSAKSVSLDLGTRRQNNLRKLVSIFEPETATEISRGSKGDRKEGALGVPTHNVSMVTNRNIPDAWITSKSEPWAKNSNQPKITAPEQMRRTSEVKPEPADPMYQAGQSGPRRGRLEWRRLSSSNRSKSLDCKSGESQADEGGRTGLPGYWDKRGGFSPRQSESSERGGGGDKGETMTTTTTTTKLDQAVKEYNLGENVELKNLKIVPTDLQDILKRSRPVSLPLQIDNGGQSLPSRIKPRLSDSEVEGDTGVWGLRRNGRRIAEDVSSNKFISGSMTSQVNTQRDTGSVDRLKKQNSLPVPDLSEHRKWGEQRHQRCSLSHDPPLESEPSRQCTGVPYEGGQGGTFPRRYSKGENKDSETGTTWIRRNSNDGSNMSGLRLGSSVAKAGAEWSGGGSPGKQQQTQISLIGKDERVGRLSDRGKNSQASSDKLRSVMSTAKITSPQPQAQSVFESAAIAVSDLPQATQSRAVTDKQEKEREYKKGKEEIQDMWSDLDPGIEQERDKKRFEGGFCDHTTGRLGKHDLSEQNCSKTRESRALKAEAICERTPAVKLCRGSDSSTDSLPKMKLASTLQPGSSALGGVNRESRQDLAGSPGGRPDYGLVAQPALKTSKPTDWRGRREKSEEQDDVFRLNNTPRLPGNRPNGEFKTGVGSTSMDNVRSKISRFETLSQQSQPMSPCPPLWSRRAFSASDHPKEASGVQKSASEKAFGVLRRPGPVGLGERQFFKRVGGGLADETVRRNWEVRSFSVDEEEQRRLCRGREVFDSGIRFPQLTKLSASRDASYNSAINTEPQRDFKVSSDEPDSSRASQDETKDVSGQQGEISQPVITNPTPTRQTDCNNSNNVGLVTGITDISGKNACEPENIFETDLGDKMHIDASSRSPFISNTKNNDTSGSICPDLVSESGPQASARTVNTTEEASLSVCTVNSIPSVSLTPAPESAPRDCLLPQATSSSSSTDPKLCSGETLQIPAKGPKESFGGAMARWSNDVNLWNDDDDSDEGTERGSNYDSDSGESSVTITSNMSQSDRMSFSVSLADLYNFGALDYMGQDYDPEDMDEGGCLSRRTASLSSDISALSTISIMPTEELDRLLDEVKGLGEETLQENYEDMQVVVLHKELGCGLGFTVAGGVDQNKPITVHKIFPSGLAAQEGSMREGDRVLSINGTPLKDSAHWEALRILRKARTRPMAVVVLQKGGAAETKKPSSADGRRAAVPQHAAKKGRTIQVVLNKLSTDLGFSLEGGLGSNMGDRPLTVKKLFQGGPVDDVFPGDELLEIEGQTMQGLRRLEAWNLIKKLPPGPVEVVLNRPSRPQCERGRDT